MYDMFSCKIIGLFSYHNIFSLPPLTMTSNQQVDEYPNRIMVERPQIFYKRMYFCVYTAVNHGNNTSASSL